MSSVAAIASLCRSKMLSDSVSAQEDGGCICIFITGVTCEGNEIEDRVYVLNVVFVKVIN